MSDFYLILPSNDDSFHSHQNSACHYKTQLNQEIKLDGDWEVGISEIDYKTVSKDIESVKLDFVVYQFDGKSSAKGVTNEVFNQLPTTAPYNFGLSSEFTSEISITIPKSTEGISSIMKMLKTKYSNSDYSHLVESLSFEFGLVITKITIMPIEYPANSDYWHYIIPKGDSNWNELFSYNWNALKDWRWYLNSNTDFHLYFNKSFIKKNYGDFRISYASIWNQVFILESKDLHDDTPKRLNPGNEILENSTLLDRLAVNNGAFQINGFQTSLFLEERKLKNEEHNSEFTQGNFDYKRNNVITDMKTELLPRIVYLRRSFWSLEDATDIMLIYTDIIESSLFSNSEIPILRTIPYNKYGLNEEYNHVEFSPIFYKKLCKTNFDSISILIANGVGQFVKFNSRVQIILHFRKING